MSAFDEALKAALGRMRSRERFAAELRAWLQVKGHEEAVVDEVLAHLTRRSLLSDERAARELIRRNSGKRAVGAERLKSQLEQHGSGISVDGLNESERAQHALAGHRTAKTPLQAARFLASRGFDEDAIRSAVEARFGPSE